MIAECYTKLKFIFNYFHKALQETEERNITYYRQGIEGVPQNFESFLQIPGEEKVMRELLLEGKKKIEDYAGKGYILGDFANEYIGGGAASFGNVQEEIMFACCPELFPSMLFCEKMNIAEAITIKGAKQYSGYTGYGGSLEFSQFIAGHATSLDALNRIEHTIVAFDAQVCRTGLINQLHLVLVIRDLIKAYVAFKGPQDDPCFEESKSKIVTGKWGCGIFNGNPELKLIIQWVAASLCDRDMIFTTFGDKGLEENIKMMKLVEKFKGKSVSRILEKLGQILELPNRDISGGQLLFKISANL